LLIAHPRRVNVGECLPRAPKHLCLPISLVLLVKVRCPRMYCRRMCVKRCEMRKSHASHISSCGQLHRLMLSYRLPQPVPVNLTIRLEMLKGACHYKQQSVREAHWQISTQHQSRWYIGEAACGLSSSSQARLHRQNIPRVVRVVFAAGDPFEMITPARFHRIGIPLQIALARPKGGAKKPS
jgi:hypothetical protein